MERLKTSTQCLLFVAYEGVQNIEDLCKSGGYAQRPKIKTFVLLPTVVSRIYPKLCQSFTRCGVQILTSQEYPALSSALRNNKVGVLELILVQGKHRHVSVEAGNVGIVSVILGKRFIVGKTKCSPCEILRGAVDVLSSEVLKSLLTVKVDISHRNPRGGTLLHLAVCRNSSALFKALLDHGADVNSCRKDGSTPLHLAALKGDIEFVRLLLEKGANIDARRNDGLTSLLLAAEFKHERAFELLLQSGATIPAESDEYVKLLRLAVKSFSDSLVLLLLGAESSSILRGENQDVFNELLPKAVERRLSGVVKQLLEYGANASMEILDGRSILHLAVCNETPGMVENLLKFNRNVTSEPLNKKALREAVLGDGENFKKITNMLLQHGLTFDANYISDAKLLYAAIQKNYLKVVEQLLVSGLDVDAEVENFREAFGFNTALVLAVKCGQYDIMELLLRKGADPNRKSWYTVPLLEAVKNRSISAVKTLLEHGAKNHPDVLNTAIRGKSGEVVEFLLQHGANPNTYDEDGEERTVAIAVAAKGDNVELMDMLLRYGADINGCNKEGVTALHAACECDSALHTIEYLIRNNADIERKDSQGFTALGYAAGKDHFEIVDMLLKSGARYNFRNIYGKTPANYDAFLAFLNHGFADDELFKSFRHVVKAPESSHYMSIYRYRKFGMRIVRHLVKMEAAGLFYTELNPMPEWTCKEMTRRDFLTKCEAEIEKMKAEIVNNTRVPFYDFLICGIRRLTSYARNENIEKMLNAGDFIKKFPIYASIINCQLRKGVFQRDLLKEGTKIFHFVFKKLPKLPDDLVEKILCHLGNQGVIVLINAVSPMDISVQSES